MPEPLGGVLEDPLSVGLPEEPRSVVPVAPASLALAAGLDDADETDAELDERESVL